MLFGIAHEEHPCADGFCLAKNLAQVFDAHKTRFIEENETPFCPLKELLVR